MTKDDEDLVKKTFGKTAEEILAWQPEDHSKYHSANAFCNNAGPEEMKHYYGLVGALTQKELVDLFVALGFVKNPAHDLFDSPAARQSMEDIIDEADREDFYREYHKLLEKRHNK